MSPKSYAAEREKILMVKARFVQGLSWLHAKVGRQIPFIRPTNSRPKASPIAARPPAHLIPQFAPGLPKA